MLGEEMGYELEFVRVGGDQSFGQIKASVVYTFSISNGHDKTKADVVITCGGVEVIEKGGKDPKTAAKIALDRALKKGRNPFASRISLQMPYGHAEYFSKQGNFDSLPVLGD
jgi:hypothetical protein